MEILYRDDHLVAIHKPAGLLVHRTAIDRHETRFALQLMRDQLGRHVYPIHRLDKPVSGVVLFALDPATARAVCALFAAGAVEKTYLAVVRGFTPLAGVIDYALREERDPRTDPPGAWVTRPAVTVYRRLRTLEVPCAVGRYPSARYSLLSIAPRTGRRHQIRRHLKHIFHPVIGDTTHGDGRHNAFFREHFACRRLLLAATALTLRHPHIGAALCVKAPVEGDFAWLLAARGWQHDPAAAS